LSRFCLKNRASRPVFPFDLPGGGAYTPPAPETSGTRAFQQPKQGAQVNKNDLVAAVADAADLSKDKAQKAVDALFDQIQAALKNGDEVRIVGFGAFTVATRKASEGRNPRTGETIKIPASKQPKFRAGKALKDSVQ
jgi:DNA-binding protein HU-beta